jgi:hypothetical protein
MQITPKMMAQEMGVLSDQHALYRVTYEFPLDISHA